MSNQPPTGVGPARRTFVCLSSQRWSDPMWTNKQHVMSRLARDHRVFYVDPGTWPLGGFVARRLRAARLGSPGRSLGDLVLQPLVAQRDGVTVLEFPAPRFIESLPHGSRARAAGEFDLRKHALGRWLRAQKIDDAILWVYHPGYGGDWADVPHALLVYDCVDEYSAFPELRGAEVWIRRRERALCTVSDLVFCTSAPLHEAKQRLAPGRTHLVPNVGDAAHFAAAAAPETLVPEDVARLPRPMVGFVGAVSGYKLDLAWLAHLARARPAWSVVLVGPRGVADPSTDLSPLEALPNVHLLGHRPYGVLPGYLKAFDVAVIPYRLNDATRAVFPIKFFELLGSGRPVVISRLPSLAAHLGAVRVADDADGFVRACDEALGADDAEARARRMALARANTWDVRVAALVAHVERALALSVRTPPGSRPARRA